MPIIVERLPDEPIIIATFHDPIDFKAESARMFQQFIDIRDSELEGFTHYYTIIHTNGARTGFSDIVLMMGESRIARQQRREDMTISLILVGSGALMEMATKAVGQNQYGNYGMRLFTSLDEALEIVREELAEMPAL